MKHRVLFIVSVLILLLLLAGCGNEPAPPTALVPTAVALTAVPSASVSEPSPDNMQGAVILLERSGSLQGVDEWWAVYEDGRSQSSRGTSMNIAPEHVRTALEGLIVLGFFEFEDSYGTTGTCNDCVTYRLTVDRGGANKTVTAVQGAADTPPEVLRAMELISALVSGVTEG